MTSQAITPLHVAAAEGQIATAQSLLLQGADVNAKGLEVLLKA